jgi:methylase of polypeptide subunit release factors
LTLSAETTDARADGEAALCGLLQALRRRGYHFITPTPETHRRVLKARREARARTLRDVFGWSLPFGPDVVDAELEALLRTAGALEPRDGLMASVVRVSSLDGELFLHSAFPPDQEDAVFFGPDTYRFASFLAEMLRGRGPVARAVDIGAGAGPGGIFAARRAEIGELILSDVNTRALRLARANARAAGVAARTVESAGFKRLDGLFDLVIANPPFIAGSGGRTYRDGGGMLGAELSLEWAVEGARRLAPGGLLLLYTGSAIVAGEDRFQQALEAALQDERVALDYRELDPDIFGEMIGSGDYAEAERMAAVGVRIERPA